MKMTTGTALSSAARWIVYGLVFLLPLFFLPVSLDALEVNKQTLLVIGVVCAALCWVGSMLAARTLTLRRGWPNLIPLFLLAPAVISAFFSSAPYVSWVGSAGQQYMSVLTLFALAVLIALLTHALGGLRSVRTMSFVLLLSALFAGFVGICSLFGMPLFSFAIAKTQAFSTVGTLNALALFLVMACVLANAIWIIHHDSSPLIRRGSFGVFERAVALGVCFVTLIVLLVLDYWVLWAALIVGLGVLFAFALLRPREFDQAPRLILPFFLITVAFLFLFFLSNPFTVSPPIEVTPSHETSWEIATKSFEEHSPWFGAGGGTYVFLFDRYRPLDINATDFWNVRFDRGSSFALTLLPAFGWAGVAVWLLAIGGLFVGGLYMLAAEKTRERWAGTLAVFAPWCVSVFGLFAYSANMTLLFVFALFSGMLASEISGSVWEGSFKKTPRTGMMFSFAFILLSIGLVTLIFLASQRYLAEAAFAEAVRDDRGGEDLAQVIASLDRAATFNQYDDIYYRNLAQALLLQVGDLLGADGQHAAALSPEQRQYLSDLTGASVNSAVRATELSRENAINWLTRGSVYREFIPLIANAGEFAIVAYERAIALEPTSPINQTELGKTYLALADAERELTFAEDEAVRTQAQRDVEALLVQAESAFNRAIDLKGDYAPAHYQLAVTYDRQGRLDDAIGKMESVAAYNQLDVGVAFQLGLLYLRRGDEGDLARAQKQFEYAVELAPAYANAHWFLAAVYEQQGNIEGAIAHVEKVAELNPGNELILQRLERLKAGETSEDVAPLVEFAPSAVE